MRRPDRLIRWRNRLGRRVIEPESFVSSSCVGDQIQHLDRHLIRKMASPRSRVGKGRVKQSGVGSGPLRIPLTCLSRPGYLQRNWAEL
jgi:hypothetical protein